jgi:hypothetical protein
MQNLGDTHEMPLSSAFVPVMTGDGRTDHDEPSQRSMGIGRFEPVDTPAAMQKVDETHEVVLRPFDTPGAAFGA